MTSPTQYGNSDSSFLAAGGIEGIRRLVENFYHKMDTLAFAKTIRGMHPDDLTSSIDKLSLFLCGWLGGPRLYKEKYGAVNIPKIHAPFPIDDPDARAWLECMRLAISEQDYQADFCVYLNEQLRTPASRILAYQHKQD
ncbi:MAG: group II truncated hemoglobin [Gammaproteobacteria bacterium]|nr:group II truncated hemoglobin [Gammaproteobacteria bacterium]